MTDPFLIRLVLSFITGFIWITVLMILAERFGTKAGGAIAGIPATMVVALLFIGLTQSAEIASESTTVVPLVVGINVLFVVLYITLVRKVTMHYALFASLIMWSGLSSTLVLARWNSFVLSIIAYITLVAISYYILEKRFRIRSLGRKAFKYTFPHVMFRGLVGGSLIFFAVAAAKFGGPLLGGVLASFPALTVAMIIITQISHDAKYTEALLKNFIITGTINVVIFVIAIRYTYLTLGLISGTIISLAISLIAFYLGYKLINKKMT